MLPAACAAPAVLAWQVVESSDGVRSLSAALIAWPNLIAANLCFFPAGAIQVRAGKRGCRGLQP